MKEEIIDKYLFQSKSAPVAGSTIYEMKKKIEQILEVYHVAPHAPAAGTTWKYNRCGDCFCTIQKVHSHSRNEQYVKPLLELFKSQESKNKVV